MSRLLLYLRQLVPGRTFVRSVLVLAGATTLGQGLTALAFPILTRLYTPTNLGTLAVYSSLLSILWVIASLQYELAIPLPKDDSSVAALLVLSLVIVFCTGLLCAVGVWAFGDRIVHWTNATDLAPYLWLLPLALLGAGAYKVLYYWALRQRAFTPIAWTRTCQGLVQVITQLGLGILRFDSLGLILGESLGRATGIWTLTKLVYQQDGKILRQMSVGCIGRLAWRYWRFPTISTISALLNIAALQLPALLLAAFYGTQVAGWFAFALKVGRIPTALLGLATGDVYFGESSRLAREAPQLLRRLFLLTALRLFALGIIPIGLLALTAPQLFVVVFGATWRESGVYVQLLSLMLPIEMAVSPVSQIVYVVERQDWQLFGDAARLTVILGVFFLAHILALDSQWAIALYAVGMLVTYLLYFLLYALATWRYSKSQVAVAAIAEQA